MLRPAGDLKHVARLPKIETAIDKRKRELLQLAQNTVSGTARKMGLSRRGIQKMLAGESMPRVDHFLDLCEVLAIKPSELYAFIVAARAERSLRRVSTANVEEVKQ